MISFNNIESSSASSQLIQSQQPEDPYSILKQEILQISTNNQRQQQNYNLQMMPYSQPPKPSLSRESLNSLYSMNRNPITHIHHQYPPTIYNNNNYPAIGFSHFMQPSPTNFYPYQQSNYYSSSNNSQVYWSSVSSTSSSSSTLQQIVNTSTPIQQQQEQPKPSTSKDYVAASQSAPVVRKDLDSTARRRNSKISSDNLIDFDVEDSSKDASNILQTFDPLATNRNSTEEAEKTFYTDQDPFDYIYSGGTQCSDPVYDAIVRSEYSFTSSKPQTPHELPYESDTCKNERPPPLPPRNEANKNDDTYNGMVQSFQKKLYENVTHHKKFDRDMIAFYTMVKELRSQYAYDDIDSNVGHVIAAGIDHCFSNVSSIKLLVYPSKECFKGKLPDSHSYETQQNYEKLDGYANPIVFTCDINSNVMHVIMHVLVVLESDIVGSHEDFALKTIGSQEWLSEESTLGRLEYIQTNIKLEKDVLLGLLPKQERFMRILARTRQDDVRDADIKLENILPKESYSAISYDNLMILLETLELEIDKLESVSTGNQVVHSSGVVQAVKAICALLGCIDTMELFNSINSLKDACSNRPVNVSDAVLKTLFYNLQVNHFF